MGFYALAMTTMGVVYTLTITWIEAAAYRFAGEAAARGLLVAISGRGSARGEARR